LESFNKPVYIFERAFDKAILKHFGKAFTKALVDEQYRSKNE
jgi:ABC-type transporter lipoprotein component MlaA